MTGDAWFGLGVFSFLFIWIGWTVVIGLIALQKNRSAWGCVFASLFLSPFFVYLYLLAVPPLPDSDPFPKPRNEDLHKLRSS